MKYNSTDSEEIRNNGEKPHYHCTLHELFPNEISFFKRRFVWPSNNAGVYVRHRYESIKIPCGPEIPKWIPLKSRGNWQHLYPALVDSLVEKHLNFEKFYKLHSYRDRLSPNSDETAFWFGTMAGDTTYNDCIDLDSHDQIGWNPIPTLWHSSRTGSCDGDLSWRFVPVVRPSLRLFQIAKVVYDNFPNRIWAFSSANFGLAVWKVYDQPELTHVVHRKIEATLKAAGLTVEHYPMPAKSGLGRCHRRPCGMDSAIITDEGLITDSIEQVRAFMKPPKTPTFQNILKACLAALRQSYEVFLAEGESIAHTRLTSDQRKDLIASCLETLDIVEKWACDGCRIDQDLILEQKLSDEDSPESEPDVTTAEFSGREAAFETRPNITEISEQYPDFFKRVDLKEVARSSQWVPFVKFLVDHGIPVEDMVSEIIHTLALWFGFVELFGEDRDRIKAVLTTFALTQHNDKVSRLLAGLESEVVAHVERIADSALNGEDAEGKQIFAEIRQKRANGQYKTPYFFESQIMNREQDHLPPPSTADNSLSYLICGGLISDSEETEQESEWKYEPDETPLPAEVINRILAAFKANKRQIRIDKTTGRYAIIDAITRFFNYLFCGQKSGTRRASQILLGKMGLPTNNGERCKVIAILEDFELLHRGGYLSGQKSRQWFLDASVIEAMQLSRQRKRDVS